jgi:hypothetical protein
MHTRSAMVRASMVAPAPLEPPSGLRATLRHLGPSFILVGSRIAPGPAASGLLWLCSSAMVALGLYASGCMLWG